MTALPSHARVVIVGGGVAGASVAYHLARLGCEDVLLLERHRLTSGTTWHAAGLIMQLRSTHALTDLARYNVELYAALEAETGQATGFRQHGTLGVCRTRDRLFETRRLCSIARTMGIEAQMIGPGEAKTLYPAIDERLLTGAIFIPGDGQTNPVDTTMALAAGARQRGVRIVEGHAVSALERLVSGEFGVSCAEGTVRCETLVLACGLWTRELAAQLGVRVPLYPCEHFYVVTEPLAEATPGLPVLRDTDGHVYVKEDAGKWLVGAFEPWGKPLRAAQLPADSAFIELPEDWDHFALPFSKAAEILPSLERAGIAKFFNGPESFTPDLLFVLGEAPGVPRCFVSAGYNSEGIELGAGAGRALAEWVVEGAPTRDLSHVDIARFHPFQVNRRYLHERTAEVVGLHYKPHWPHYQPETSRNVRRGVLHERMASLGASFGEGLGWERPMWFAPPGASTRNVYSHTRPGWFEATARECEAARLTAVLFDQSSFGKHRVEGPGACAWLQRLCAGDVDVPIGKVVYTHMLNPRGGIETDVTVTRQREDRYLLVSSATSFARDHAWMCAHLDSDRAVTLTDVTAQTAVLSIQGPRSRDVLAQVTDTDLGAEAFPFATAQTVDIGYARALAVRLTYVGELGWELHVPAEQAQHVFDRIWAAGRPLGLVPAGYHALEHLRCERAYREYGLDLTPEDTPLEAGLGYTVSFGKPGGFVGRDALLRERERGALRKRLVMFMLDDPTPVLFHDEPVLMDGRIVGFVSSGAFGFTLGASVGMGYVRHPEGVTRELVARSKWSIEIACKRHPAKASLRAFFDPDGARTRG